MSCNSPILSAGCLSGPWNLRDRGGRCSQGQGMLVGRLPASVLYPPLSFPQICPRHARANERNSIQAPHVVGVLSLWVSPEVPPACPYRRCPSTPCAHTREPLPLQSPRAALGLPSKTPPHCLSASALPDVPASQLPPRCPSALMPFRVPLSSPSSTQVLHLPIVLFQSSCLGHNPGPCSILRTPTQPHVRSRLVG